MRLWSRMIRMSWRCGRHCVSITKMPCIRVARKHCIRIARIHCIAIVGGDCVVGVIIDNR